MTPPTTARTRIKQWLAVYGEASDTASLSQLATPLLVGDLKALVEAFDQPCGSCHPCTNYADETWRAAGRKPPHVYDWDLAVRQRQGIRDLLAYCREGDGMLSHESLAERLETLLELDS